MDSRATIRSGDAVFSFGSDLVIETWNEAAEALTGVPAAEAVGRPCWLVLGATADNGDTVCHAGCANARLAREGWPVTPRTLQVRDPEGQRRPVRVSTVRIERGEGPLFLHLLTETSEDAPLEPPRADAGPELSTRQRQVLDLIAAGRGARSIAAELRLAESTVRNHIRAVLVAFGAHSQIEAVAKARACGTLSRGAAS
jgi:PAS domain S-box-containing protein